jgi:hypothetical protein
MPSEPGAEDQNIVLLWEGDLSAMCDSGVVWMSHLTSVVQRRTEKEGLSTSWVTTLRLCTCAGSTLEQKGPATCYKGKAWDAGLSLGVVETPWILCQRTEVSSGSGAPQDL